VTPGRTVFTNATRREVLRLLGRLGRVLSGRAGAPTGASAALRSVGVRVGLAALGHVHQAFVVKARGGTDEAGLRWAPLSWRTVAYSRRHPGVPKKRPRDRYHPSWALSNKQRQRWWLFYRRALGRHRGDKAHAAASAWVQLTGEGRNPTLKERYAGTRVEILRDTGLLLSSLKPGADPGRAPASPPRVRLQVFRLGYGSVTIGTSRPWAGTHHKGIPGRLPRRPLWPDPGHWPGRWWDELLGQFRAGVVEVIAKALGG
jgi:hypothetical protein